MKHKRIFWGILLILIAVTIIFSAFMPNVIIINIPVWKIALAVLVLYWIIEKIFTERTLAKKLNLFLPVSLLFLLLKDQFAFWFKFDANSISWWHIVLAGLLLSIAMDLICGQITVNVTHSGSSEEPFTESTPYSYSFSDATCYLDATKNDFFIKNSMGHINIHIQNADQTPEGYVMHLRIVNNLGQMTVHVPADWKIDASGVQCNLGEVNVRDTSGVSGTKSIVITGENHCGETEII